MLPVISLAPRRLFQFSNALHCGIEFRRDHEIVVSNIEKLWFDDSLTLRLGNKNNGNNLAVPSSCSRLVGYWLQEGVHRDSSAGDLAQTFGEAQGRLFAAIKDVAQVRNRALSGLGELPDRQIIGFRPAEHGVLF